MTRSKKIFAVLAVAAIVALTATANATTAHVVGVGSSAQFLGSAIGADNLAKGVAGLCPYHWTQKTSHGGIWAHDNRDSLGRILDENGNVGVVWTASCTDGTGNTNITDVWIFGQYDSTLGNRLLLAQQKAPTAGKGATVYVTATNTADNLVAAWPDGNPDVVSPANLQSFIGTSAPGTLHVNLALSDIRSEDALAATTRTKAALNTTTWAGLGYVGPTAQIGAPILEYNGAGSFTPVGFALCGGTDPINTGTPVPACETIPVGAAPIMFAYNNGGTYNSKLLDLNTGINGYGLAGGPYNLAHLFDGTTACNTNNAAFTGGGDGLGTAIQIILREPLSGTMNTTEYSVFRTTGNLNDSQEKGIINPTRAPYNPLNLPCAGGGGNRVRRIGTGDVLSEINSVSNSMGYFFFSFANAAKLVGQATPKVNYQYFTVDGADPTGLPLTGGQQLVNACAPAPPAVCNQASEWPGGISFPTLRNGTYGVWSVYRWIVYTPDSDPLGPTALAHNMQDNIDAAIETDFVPFETTGNADGLNLYHSHFTQSLKSCGYTLVAPGNECNGGQSPTEAETSGNSLGGNNTDGTAEQGGDEGGVIFGWDHSTVTVAAGIGAEVNDWKLTKTAGRTFGFSGTENTHAAGNPAILSGATVYVSGLACTQDSAHPPTAALLYVTKASCALTAGAGQSFAAYIAPTENAGPPFVDGALAKKR